METLACFGICFLIWVIGFMILDPKSWLRFFKQEVYIMDKQAVIIAVVCYAIMLVIIGALSYVHQQRIIIYCGYYTFCIYAH